MARKQEKLTTDPQEKKQLQQQITILEQFKNKCDNLVQETDAAKLAKGLKEVLKLQSGQ